MTVVSGFHTAGLQVQIKLHGETVTYDDGTTTVTGVKAIRAKAQWSTDEPERGLKVGERSQDWILEASKVVDGAASQIEPDRGHTITTADGEVFRVMPSGPDKQNWRWVDPSGKTFRRVFTQERS